MKVLGWVLLFFLLEANAFASGAMTVGFSEVPFELPESTPLGGYGTGARRLSKPNLSLFHSSHLFRPASGTLDSVRAKAMVLKNGQKKLAFLSLDLVGVTARFRKDLLKKLKFEGYGFDNLMVSATHTHSGPGALSHNLFWEAIALDFYQKGVYEAVLRAAVNAVVVAEHGVQPAKVYHSTVDVPGVQHNRHGHPERVDPKAHLLWVKAPDGRILGTLANFAIHGTALDEENLFFSADVPGAIERSLIRGMKSYNDAKEVAGWMPEPIAVFVNSAEADVLPNKEGEQALPWVGEIFSDAAMLSADRGEELPDSWRVDEARIPMPIPGMNIQNCVHEFRSDKPNAALKFFTRDSALHLAALFFPVKTRIARIRWGGLDLVTWPGEPTTKLGWMLKDQAISQGSKEVMILGLTNDHLAYFLSEDEFYEGGYESCFSFYGARGGEKIIHQFKKLMHPQNVLNSPGISAP